MDTPIYNKMICSSVCSTSVYIVFTQVFHSLLKAHAVEARAVVKQALEILTPAMPGRMEDGNVSLYMHNSY